MTNYGKIVEANRRATERFNEGRALTIKYGNLILTSFRNHLGETADGMHETTPAIPQASQVFVHTPTRPEYVNGMPIENCLRFEDGIWSFGLGLKLAENDIFLISILIKGKVADDSAKGFGEYAVMLDNRGGGYYLSNQLQGTISEISSRFLWALDHSIHSSSRTNPILIGYDDVETL